MGRLENASLTGGRASFARPGGSPALQGSDICDSVEGDASRPAARTETFQSVLIPQPHSSGRGAALQPARWKHVHRTRGLKHRATAKCVGRAVEKFARAACWSAVVALGLLLAGCSVKQFAIKQLGSALADGSSGAFAAESDVEFAGQAVPFSLKLIESLLWEQPDNFELLTAAAGGFTQYAYVWVQQPADFIEADDYLAAQRGHDRARAFYLRAHNYAMRGLAARHAGFAATFEREPHTAVAMLTKADVPLMYWGSMSLGAAISLGKTDPGLIARQPQVEALIDRAMALDPDWSNGALREFLMSYELARPGAGAEGVRKARALFDRIVADTQGLNAGPFVVMAESVSIQQQNRAEFAALLGRALAIDPAKTPKNRLANVVMQERARWLLGRVDELFLE